MSLRLTNVVSWKLNEQGVIDITIKMPDQTDAIVQMPETMFSEMIESIPALEEEKKLLKLLNSLYDIRQKRLLIIDEIATLIENKIKQHETVRKNMEKSDITKTEIFALTAQSKDLGLEKVLLDTKRHLCGLLIREEARIRADIAKLQAGR